MTPDVRLNAMGAKYPVTLTIDGHEYTPRGMAEVIRYFAKRGENQ